MCQAGINVTYYQPQAVRPLAQMQCYLPFLSIMVQIKKTWETVYFTASKKGLKPVTVELSLNHETKKYTLCTAHEESVSFKDDTIEMSKLKVEALKEAVKYIECCLS